MRDVVRSNTCATSEPLIPTARFLMRICPGEIGVSKCRDSEKRSGSYLRVVQMRSNLPFPWPRDQHFALRDLPRPADRPGLLDALSNRLDHARRTGGVHVRVLRHVAHLLGSPVHGFNRGRCFLLASPTEWSSLPAVPPADPAVLVCLLRVASDCRQPSVQHCSADGLT